ncbi:hypothetical protein LWI29_016586 [Acer saccharum]|uniref:Uncharacterized protein n=1 Tax=Acer saccharum TaxID=4024 RepID=A0AA39SYH0_ACESA|nr:hypothetical protein LWI29_016586 [Acer saccharum]
MDIPCKGKKVGVKQVLEYCKINDYRLDSSLDNSKLVPCSFVSCTYKDESCEDVQTPVKFIVKKGQKSKVQSVDQEIKIGNQEAKISSNEEDEEDVRFPGKGAEVVG